MGFLATGVSRLCTSLHFPYMERLKAIEPS